MYSYASTSTCHRLILKVHREKKTVNTVFEDYNFFFYHFQQLLNFLHHLMLPSSARSSQHSTLQCPHTPSTRYTEVTTIDCSLHILNNNPDGARPISLIFTHSKGYVFHFVLKLNFFFNVSKQTNKSINPRPYPVPCDKAKK